MGYLVLLLVWLFNWVLHAVMAPGGNLGGDAPGAGSQTRFAPLPAFPTTTIGYRGLGVDPSNGRVILFGIAGQGMSVSVGGNVITTLSDVINQMTALLQAGSGVQLGFSSASTLTSGSGAPNNANGANGDFYFRIDTPTVANQRLYVKSPGVWTGIL